MSRPESLLPAYDFSCAPEPVTFLQGKAVLSSGSESFAGKADLKMRFIPYPRIFFDAAVRGSAEPSSMNNFGFQDSDSFSFDFNDHSVCGFLGKYSSSSESAIMKLDWHPKSEPVTLFDMEPKASKSAIFHLFNFPDFSGGQHRGSAPASCKLLVLESEDWTITIQGLPDNATSEAWKRISAEGVCLLTHVLKLERNDGKPFSGKDVNKQLQLLDKFLSFLTGGRCTPVCGVGLDAAGAPTWKTFSSPYADRPPYSWFNPYQASQAELLFPLFAKRWQQSEDWKGCLRTSIYWYAQANTSGGSPSIDAAIILAQSALERLAYHYLVVDQKQIPAKDFDRLRASCRLRSLFNVCGIPNEITDVTPDILQANDSFKKDYKWKDAPHAITDIRNSLVHPVSKKKVSGCYVDAWKLSLWYLELSVLALCGYNDIYTSRLTAKYVNESEPVPWGKEA